MSFPSTPITPDNANQLVELARWGRGPVLDVAYAPDGQTLVVLSPLGLYFYDAETLDDIYFIELSVLDNSRAAIAYSPDGQLLAVGLGDKVTVWQMSDWTLMYTLPEESAVLAFSPDGTMLITGEHNIKLWRVKDAKLLRVLSLKMPAPEGYWKDMLTFTFNNVKAHPLNARCWQEFLLTMFEVGTSIITPEQFPSTAYTFSFSPDGTMLAIGSVERMEFNPDGYHFLHIWEIPSGKRVYLQEEEYGVVKRGMAFAADNGDLLAISQRMGRIKLMQVSDQTTSYVFQYPTNGGSYARIAFSPKNDVLVAETCLQDNDNGLCIEGKILLWQVETKQLLHILPEHQEGIARLLFSPDGSRLLSVGRDQSLALWDVDTGNHLNIQERHTNVVNELTLSPQNEFLATHNFGWWGRSEPELWRIADGTKLYGLDFPGFSGVATLAFSPDDHVLASGDEDGAVRLWETQTGQLLQTLHSSEDWGVKIYFSPNGKSIASLCGNCPIIRLWTPDGQFLRGLEHPEGVKQMVFSPDSSLIASYTENDQSVRLWETDTGELLHTFYGNTIDYMAFSPDGTKLYIYSSRSALLSVRQVSDEKLLYQLPLPEVRGMFLSPDGALLTVSIDNWELDYMAIHLYRAEDGVLLHIIPTWGNVSYSPDGKLLLINSGKLEFWDVASGQLVGELPYGGIGDFALTSDGTLLITGSNRDGTIRLWGIP